MVVTGPAMDWAALLQAGGAAVIVVCGAAVTYALLGVRRLLKRKD